MAHFSEAWLAEYEARRKPKPFPRAAVPVQPLNGIYFPPAAPTPPAPSGRRDDITFRLVAPLMLPNRKNNLHWSKKSTLVRALANEIAALITLPTLPFIRAEVTAWRHGITEPDADNLVSSLKWLLDVIQPQSKRHPYGLGLISGDDPAHVVSIIHHVKAKHRPDQHTFVRIRDLAELA